MAKEKPFQKRKGSSQVGESNVFPTYFRSQVPVWKSCFRHFILVSQTLKDLGSNPQYASTNLSWLSSIPKNSLFSAKKTSRAPKSIKKKWVGI
jgi:hypothetical protein